MSPQDRKQFPSGIEKTPSGKNPFTPSMEGDVVCGILTATYGEFLTATFGTWGKENLHTWRKEGAGPPAYTYEIDLDPWSWTVAPTLGGAAFAIHKKTEGPRITGIRAVPPSFDVHAYNQMRSDDTKPSTGESAKQISQDFYRQVNKPSRERHPEDEKQKARDERRQKQAEIEAKTSERYKEVFATRKTSDDLDGYNAAGSHARPSESRPSHTPVNFGMISVVRQTVPIFEKGAGKGKPPAAPLSPVKEEKKGDDKPPEEVPSKQTTAKFKHPPVMHEEKETKKEGKKKVEVKKDESKPSDGAKPTK